MRRPLLAFAAGCLVTGAAGPLALTRDRPPPAFTGGFGEPTCQLCHSEAVVNAGPGRLALDGIPETYVADTTYVITVSLVHAGAKALGFELAARFEASGAQAGALAPAAGEEGRADVTVEKGIRYLHHLRAGTAPVAPDTARWSLTWTAPAGGGPVSFHVAGNAANEDDSPLGDYVYAITAVSRPR